MYVIPDKKQPLDPYQVRAQLPKIGDRLLRTPELGLCGAGLGSAELECVVTYVHYAHRWYEVEFQGLRGPYRECYKLPDGEGYK